MTGTAVGLWHSRTLHCCSTTWRRLSASRPHIEGSVTSPGWWWSATTRSHVVYGSWLGRHHIIEADRDARVVAISGRPFELTWPEGKKQVGHVPDLLCRVVGGPVVVTDCRSASRASEKFRRKAAVVAAACSQIGWDYLGCRCHDGCHGTTRRFADVLGSVGA
jgi:hypothetical protein